MTVIVNIARVPGMARRMRAATPRVLTSWGNEQVKRLKEAYAAGGHQRHGGRPWQPKKSPGRILVGSGALRRATGFRVSGTKIVLFNKADYAAYHQEGTVDLPKRRLIVVTSKDRRGLRVKLEVGLERSLR